MKVSDHVKYNIKVKQNYHYFLTTKITFKLNFKTHLKFVFLTTRSTC